MDCQKEEKWAPHSQKRITVIVSIVVVDLEGSQLYEIETAY